MTVVQLHETCSICGQPTPRRRLAAEYPVVCEYCNRYTARGLFGHLPPRHKAYIVEKIGAACKRFGSGYVHRTGFRSLIEYETRVDELATTASHLLVGRLLQEGRPPDARERVTQPSLAELFTVDVADACGDGRVFWILCTTCNRKALAYAFANAIDKLGIRALPSYDATGSLRVSSTEQFHDPVDDSTPERNLLEAEQERLDADACDGLVIHFINEFGAREDISVVLKHLRDHLMHLIGHTGGAGGPFSWPVSALSKDLKRTSTTRPWDNRPWTEERIKTAQKRYKTGLKELTKRFPESEELEGYLVHLAREHRRRAHNGRQIRPATHGRGSHDHV
jgi:hypothetical protein